VDEAGEVEKEVVWWYGPRLPIRRIPPLGCCAQTACGAVSSEAPSGLSFFGPGLMISLGRDCLGLPTPGGWFRRAFGPME
jgi:hypothetical protein